MQIPETPKKMHSFIFVFICYIFLKYLRTFKYLLFTKIDEDRNYFIYFVNKKFKEFFIKPITLPKD